MGMSTEERLVRSETTLEQHDKRFGHIEQAITRLTWTVNLWGAVITILVAAVLVLVKK
jgi:hypothetical protein